MSDRIAVFDHGRIAQVGAPSELYDHPTNAFVAGFVGVSNFLERDGVRFVARPEKIALTTAAPKSAAGLNVEQGAIVDRVYLGMVTRYLVTLDRGESIVVIAMNGGGADEGAPLTRGARVWASWRQGDVVTLQESSGSRT